MYQKSCPRARDNLWRVSERPGFCEHTCFKENNRKWTPLDCWATSWENICQAEKSLSGRRKICQTYSYVCHANFDCYSRFRARKGGRVSYSAGFTGGWRGQINSCQPSKKWPKMLTERDVSCREEGRCVWVCMNEGRADSLNLNCNAVRKTLD